MARCGAHVKRQRTAATRYVPAMPADARQTLAERLDGMRGERCTAALSLRGDGLLFAGFGALVARAEPLPDEALPESFRRFSAETALFVECPWRIEADSGPICSSLEASLSRETAGRRLSRIVGARVVEAALTEPCLDLVVRFDNGLVLRAFCDRIDPQGIRDNWSLETAAGAWTVGGGAASRFRQDPAGIPARLKLLRAPCDPD